MRVTQEHWQFWWRWIVANALGELLGLGVVGLVGIGVVTALGEPVGIVANLGFTALMVMLGAFEGSVLGLAQGWVLRTRLPQLNLHAWISATVIGALVAWSLGLIPSLLGNLGEPANAGTVDMDGGTVFLLASLMGAGLGVVLAWPQWRVLRRYVSRAGWWLPANSAAWACGMPIIFWLAGSLPADPTLQQGALIGLLALATTGAVVGAVHGTALLWLLP
ncbi:MAG: hypothetical protein ACFCVD_15095 [Nodosilinea sp.]